MAVALALRLVGLKWALPSDLHRYTYHPDELFIIGAALTVITPPFSLNPHFYNYGSFFIYLTALATFVASGYVSFAQHSMMLRTAFLSARLVSALLGTATVLVVLAAGTRYRNKAVGLLASAILAIAPLHVQHSHFATVDVAATFWAALAVLCGLKLASGGSAGACVVGGLMAGLAAGTKYNAAMMFLPVAAGAALGSDRWFSTQALRRVCLCVGGAAAGFFISTPGALLWTHEFSRGLLYEVAHSRTGHGFVFEGTGPGWLFHLRSTLWYGSGPPLMALAAIGLGLACARLGTRTKGAIVLLVAFLPYYAWGSVSLVRFARYLLPVFPVLAIFAADGVFTICEALRKRGKCWSLCWGGLSLVAVFGVFLYTLSLDRLLVVQDPRDRAISWMRSEIPRGASLAFPTVPWFYTVPVAPETTALATAEHRYSMVLRGAEKEGWTILANVEEDFSGRLLDLRPDFVIVSDFEVLDRLRVRNRQTVEFMRRLRPGFRLVRVFANDVRLGGLKFCDSDRLPHDMKYVAPTIWVYSRR